MAAYFVRYDRAADILHFGMTGFWTMDTVRAFGGALREVVDRIPGEPRRYDALSDTGSFPVQSTEVSNALGEIMKMGLKITTGRTAVVVASRLNKLQAERTLSDPRVRIFMTMAEAQAWLAQRESI